MTARTPHEESIIIKTIHIGLLGPGKIAKRLAAALRNVKGTQLRCVCSRDLERAKAFAAEFGTPESKAFSSYDDMLADPDLDAVIIATPDKLHASQIERAARNGKHVFVEKPLCTDLPSGQKAMEACQKRNLVLSVGYHIRWNGALRQLWKKVQDGVLGELRHMSVHWGHQATDASNWRASTDVGRWWSLGGLGTHCLDVVRWFMVPTGGEIEEIKSVITNGVWKGPHDETALVTMRFASGATAEFYSSVLFQRRMRVEIHGSKGSAIADPISGDMEDRTLKINGESMPIPSTDAYYGELDHFIHCVRTGDPIEVPPNEALRNVELLLQIAP